MRFATPNASASVEITVTPRASADAKRRSPTGAESAIIIAAIPADTRANCVGSSSPTIAISF
jgi:hypothetical protein